MSCCGSSNPATLWLDYIDGRLEPAERSRIERHLTECPVCRGIHDRLATSRARLVEAAAGARSAAEPGPGSLGRIWDGLRFRIRRALHPAGEGPDPGLERLRAMLAEMCGAATAEDAIQGSALGVGQPGRPYARDLGSIVEVICGDEAGRLVRRAASRVGQDRVA